MARARERHRDGPAQHHGGEMRAIGGGRVHVGHQPLRVQRKRGHARFVEPAQQGRLGLVPAEHRRRDAGDAHPDRLAEVRDEHAGHRVAGGGMRELRIGGAAREGEVDLADQLVGLERGGEHALEEVIRGQLPAIRHHDGREGEHRGRVVRGGVVVCDGPAERPAHPHLGVADRFRHRGERRQGRGHERIACYLRMTAGGADHQRRAALRDAAQLVETAHVHQP
jgi:hypothetical protein